MWPLEKQRKTKQYKISESHFSFQKSKTSLFCTSFSGTKHSKQNQKEKNLEWNGEKDLIWIRVVEKIWRAEKQISIHCSKPWRFSTEMLDVKTNKIYSRSLPCPFTFCNCCFFFQGKFNGSCAFMRSHSSHDSYTCPQAAIWLTSGGLGSERIGPGQWCMGLSPLWHQLHRGCLVFVILN